MVSFAKPRRQPRSAVWTCVRFFSWRPPSKSIERDFTPGQPRLSRKILEKIREKRSSSLSLIRTDKKRLGKGPDPDLTEQPLLYPTFIHPRSDGALPHMHFHGAGCTRTPVRGGRDDSRNQVWVMFFQPGENNYTEFFCKCKEFGRIFCCCTADIVIFHCISHFPARFKVI